MKNVEAYVTGIGQSEVGVRLTRSPLLLTVDAIKEALADAGLGVSQIDGVSTYPGKMPIFMGFSPVSSDDVIESLGLKTRWHVGGGEITSQLGAVMEAAMAVRAGLARHVICFRTVYEAAALARPEEFPPLQRKLVEGGSQWVSPFFAFSAANWTAQYATRHMKRYGLKKEHLGRIVMNDHANATLNPRAIVKKPLSMDDYMAARPISSPFGLFDCDRFTDCSTVLIVSAGDALGEVKTTPIRLAGMSASVDRYSWDQAEWASAYPTGRDLWRTTDYTVDDVDIVQLYDGFSFQPITWLEGLGFCKLGEGGDFIGNGTRIARDGALPMNTGGGQLGAGRLHGFGFAHEAVIQLRGEGGARQVANDPKLAVATSGGGPMATALLLARD